MICKICNKEFEPHKWKSGQKSSYQSICDSCSTYDKLERTKVCPVCGKSFKETRKTLKDHWLNTVYCSTDCANKIQIETKCIVCNKVFKSSVNRYNQTKQKICSIDCANQINILSTCKLCGKNFVTHPLLDGRKRTAQLCLNCRPKERVKHISETCLSKYGVSYPCLTDNCKNNNYQAKSKINEKFCDLLEKNNISYTTEYSKISKQYSYDINLTDKNVVIEINPTITHTCIDTISIFSPKNKNYHLQKTQTATNAGYRCINVWDWDNWEQIINLIKPKQKLYARKLQLKEIDKQIATAFINKYHLQGSCYGNSVNLGLYQGDELVQVMTFGKPRYNKNYQWELLRLCTKSEYYIVGGAERLFKHFIYSYKPNSVISYCDISKFKGDVYSRLGFKEIKITEPQKVWSKQKKYITDNLLRQRGADQLVGTHDGKGTNNGEIMIREGWLPVFDCGQKVFEWRKEDII